MKRAIALRAIASRAIALRAIALRQIALRADFLAKKPSFLAPALQGAGNELTISCDNHCHCGAVHAFRSVQSP